MVSPRTHWAAVLSAYLRRGEAGLADLEERLASAAGEQPDGKFGKEQAFYLPQTPFPPALWRPSCERCRFWHEGGPGEPGGCHIVGREGDRFGGEAVHYRGWCAYWMPPRGEPPFAWVRERLRPDGKSSVRGVYDPAETERTRRRNERARVGAEPDGRGGPLRDEADATGQHDEEETGTGSGDPGGRGGRAGDGE